MLKVKPVEITEDDEEQAIAAIFGTAPFIPSDDVTDIMTPTSVHSMVSMFVAVDNVSTNQVAERKVSA